MKKYVFMLCTVFAFTRSVSAMPGDSAELGNDERRAQLPQIVFNLKPSKGTKSWYWAMKRHHEAKAKEFHTAFLQGAPIKDTPLPANVDIRQNFPGCYNQGSLGSCTANATAGIIENGELMLALTLPSCYRGSCFIMMHVLWRAQPI